MVPHPPALSRTVPISSIFNTPTFCFIKTRHATSCKFGGLVGVSQYLANNPRALACSICDDCASLICKSVGGSDEFHLLNKSALLHSVDAKYEFDGLKA